MIFFDFSKLLFLFATSAAKRMFGSSLIAFEPHYALSWLAAHGNPDNIRFAYAHISTVYSEYLIFYQKFMKEFGHSRRDSR